LKAFCIAFISAGVRASESSKPPPVPSSSPPSPLPSFPSPGYKAYYHKLYDHYWNSKNVTKGFLAAEFSNHTNLDNYLFHIVNMMNPNFNIKAMPGLDRIVEIIDLPNISRIKNTDEALTITCDILDILIQEGIDFQKKEEENHKTNLGEGEGEGGTGEGETTETEDGEVVNI